MRILLDTCTFLWIVADDPQLSNEARNRFANPANDVFLSAASSWEIAVKQHLGKLPLPETLATLVPRYRKLHGIVPLPIEEDAVLQLPKLPNHHRDPFDRMLICQAIHHGLVILTPDPAIQRYPVRTVW